MKEDLKLVWKKFLNDDVEAFAIIYNSYVDSLFRYGLKINPNEEAVKDTIQEIFLDLYLKKQNNKTNPENLKYYLILAVKRNLIKKLKKDRTLIPQKINDSDIFDAEYSIEQEIIEKERDSEIRSRVANALGELTVKQKEAIYLRFNESLEYEEIAEILKITVESVRKQVWRALKSIRESVDSESITLFFAFLNKISSKKLSI